jgi:hypothetical protein
LPFYSPKKEGMLKNINQLPCKDVNRTVPYYKELTQSRPNNVIWHLFNDISSGEVSLDAKDLSVPMLVDVPDGVINI